MNARQRRTEMRRAIESHIHDECVRMGLDPKDGPNLTLNYTPVRWAVRRIAWINAMT